jgi:predicted RNase H-like nuclease (RuvC/YqgF family)
MTYSDVYKASILQEAKATLKRTSQENLDRSRIRYEERHGATTLQYSEPPEDRVEKWKRERRELEDDMVRERERISMVAELYRSTMKCQTDIAEGLGTVGRLAEAISNRIDDMGQEIAVLKSKLEIAETRFEDLKRTFDGRATATNTVENGAVIDLKPNRRA